MPIDILAEIAKRRSGIAPKMDLDADDLFDKAKIQRMDEGGFEAPSTFEKGLDIYEGISQASGAVGTGFAGSILGGWAGLGQLGKEGIAEAVERLGGERPKYKTPTQMIEDVAAKLQYQPETELGMKTAEKAMWPFEKVREISNWVGGHVLEKFPDSPNFAASAAVGVELVLLGVGAKFAKGTLRSSRRGLSKLSKKIMDSKDPNILVDPKIKAEFDTILKKVKAIDPAMDKLIREYSNQLRFRAIRTMPKEETFKTKVPIESISAQKLSIDELFAKLEDHPLYKEREVLYEKDLELSFISDRQTIEQAEANWPRRLEVKKRIKELTKQISELPENKEWFKAYEAKDEIRVKDELRSQTELLKKGEVDTSKSGVHGTDFEDLASILDEGLRPGSAMDYTVGKEWASDYPVIVRAPFAGKGKYIEHNKFYNSASRSVVDKVEIDFDHYTKEATPKYRKKLAEFKKKYPDVEFVDVGKLKPKKVPPPTFKSQADKYNLDYEGPTGEKVTDTIKGKKVEREVHEYFDPETGERFTVDSARSVKDQLETHRANVKSREATYGDLVIDDFRGLADRWDKGDVGVKIEDVESALLKTINEKPRTSFETAADYLEFIDEGEALLGQIKNRKIQKGIVSEAKLEVKNVSPLSKKAQVTMDKLNEPPIAEPKKLTIKERVELLKESKERTSAIKRDEIEAALEEGKDISDKLPPEVRESYRVYRESQEHALETSEPRNLGDIYNDVTTLIDERGSFSFEKYPGKKVFLSHKEKMALQRLMADAKRAGKDVGDILTKLGYSAEQAAILRGYMGEFKRVIEPESHMPPVNVEQKSHIAGDKIVKQRRKGKDSKGVQLTAIELYDSEVKSLTAAKEISARRDYKSLETAPRTFEQAELTWPLHRAREALADAQREFNSIVDNKLKPLRKSLSRKSGDRIGIYGIAQQGKRGLALVKKMGKEVPDLPKDYPAEFKAYETMRGWYREFLERVNEVRVRIGKESLEEVPDYMTFIRTFNILEARGFEGKMQVFTHLVLDSPKTIMNRYNIYMDAPFRFAKLRKTGIISVETNAFKIMETYSRHATRHIHVSPVVAKVSELLGKLPDESGKLTWSLADTKPNLAGFLRDWNNTVSGRPISNAYPILSKISKRLRKNLAYSILGCNVRTVAIQPFAWINTISEIGSKYWLRGLELSLDSKMRNFATEKSNHLITRMPEVEVSAEGVLASTLIPMMKTDMIAARATWLGAYKYGRDVLGYKGRRLYNYADDVTVRTQASASIADLAPIQKVELGKMLTLFQTFVINNWGFLTRDVLGIGNVKITNRAALRKVSRYVISAAIFNTVFEGIPGTDFTGLGIKSPLPTPTRTIMEGLEEGSGIHEIAWDVALEFIELMPLIGGIRYEKEPFGAGIELVGDIIETTSGAPMAKSWTEVGARAAGVPGAGQVGKMTRAKERGESTWGQIFGSYTKPKGKKLKRLKGLGGLGGS